jgi:hypothetical protein
MAATHRVGASVGNTSTRQPDTNAANLQRVVQAEKSVGAKRAAILPMRKRQTTAAQPQASGQPQIASRGTTDSKPQVQSTGGPSHVANRTTAKEVAPPKLPVPKDDSTNDTNIGSWQASNRENDANQAKISERGSLRDVKPHTQTNNGLDGNDNFKRVVGSADSSKLPVYQVKDKSNSYVMPIDLSKVSLSPSADRSADGKDTPTSAQPNPLYSTSTISDHSASVMSGKRKDIDSSKYLGAFNSAFFNSYRPDTTLSYSSLVNGQVASTGKVEPGKKLLLSWDNKTGVSNLTPWKANTEGGFASTTTAGKAVNLASPNAVKQGFGSLVGNKNANGFVGTDAKSLVGEAKSERGTYVGTNGKGKMAVLVAGDNMTAKEAVATLGKAGYNSNVVKLDSGPSSQLSLVTNRQSSNWFTGAKTDTRDAENMFDRIKGRETPVPINIISK